MPHAGLPEKALPPGRVRGKCPDATRLRYQCAKKTRQQTLGGWWAVSMLRFLTRPTVGTCRNLQHSRRHARTPRVRSRCGLRLETCRPWQRNPEGSPLRNPGRLIFSPPLLSRDAVRPWKCVWPPLLQQQLAETQHRRHLIPNSRTTEMKLWNCDNRCLDSGWATAPSRHSNASVRSRQRLQSKRAADVGEITSAHAET